VIWLSVAVATALVASAAPGGLNEPIQIGEELGAITEAVLEVDSAQQPVLAFSAGTRVYVALGHDGFKSLRPVDGELASEIQDLPSLETDLQGTLYVAFRETDGEEKETVRWTSSPGGRFQPPKTVPDSSTVSAGRPWIRLLPHGPVVLVWVGRDGEGEDRILCSVNGEPAVPVAAGSDASFVVDSQGGLHLAFIREGALFYTYDEDGDPRDGGFVTNERVIADGQTAVSNPQIGVLRDGTPYVLYETQEDGIQRLFLTGEDWTVHKRIADGVSASKACLSVFDSGLIVVYMKGSQIYALRGLSLSLLSPPETVGILNYDVEQLYAAVDSSRYLHLAFIVNGRLYYTNNCPPPRADFTAEPDPPQGEYPLTVSFKDLSEGHVLQYMWDFGDGSPRRQLQNPEHTYQQPGVYDVTLRVTGVAGASDVMVRRAFVTVTEKQNHLVIPNVTVYAGQRNFLLPVRATNVMAIQGFQLAGRFDPRYITLGSGNDFLDLTFTTSAGQEPEFVAASQDPQEGWFTVGVIYDTAAPIIGKAVPPGRDVNLINLIISVSGFAENRTQTALRLENGVGDPPIANIFTVKGGVSVYPELHSGTITIVRPDVEFLGPLFLRGDANNDGTVSIADAIFILGYLFSKGEEPYCADAADFDDNQSINIGDAIATLSYLFGNKTSPAPPFPSPGLDPTEDDLPPCGGGEF